MFLFTSSIISEKKRLARGIKRTRRKE